MKLTVAQLRRCNIITSAIERQYGEVTARPAFRFNIHCQWEDGAIMLCATNLPNVRWFETMYHATVVITRRGGIERYAGNMRPKLVLPATPRHCTYDEPFKHLRKEKP